MIAMNYEKEINAFFNHIELNPVSTSAMTLWFALMHISYKTMWAATFTVDTSVLRLKSGLTKRSFRQARTELKKKGYIDYESRDLPLYRIVSLVLKVN